MSFTIESLIIAIFAVLPGFVSAAIRATLKPGQTRSAGEWVAGSIVASLMLGVLESFGAVYISYDYRDTFGLVILMLVLLVRPQGLFGEKGREV